MLFAGRLSAEQILAPCPDPTWVVAGLQLGAGRPALLVGASHSGKTILAQDLALAVASGADVWGRFGATRGRVLHLDLEQGQLPTRVRYQRLARGAGLDPTLLEGFLFLEVFPPLDLTVDSSAAQLLRACSGMDLVIIDSLRAAAPNADESSSVFRKYIDALTKISETSGCAFLVTHHEGKKRHGGPASAARGSSAIIDAAGSVLTLAGGGPVSKPISIVRTKSPAEAVGRGNDSYRAWIEDVAHPEYGPLGGLRVRSEHAQAPAGDATTSSYEARIVQVVQDQPGIAPSALSRAAKMRKQTALDVAHALVASGQLRLAESKLFPVSKDEDGPQQ